MNAAGAAVLALDASHIVDGQGNHQTNAAHTVAEKACFYNVRQQFHLENVLRSVSFVPKRNCRAIQMADLIAFHSRRHSVGKSRQGPLAISCLMSTPNEYVQRAEECERLAAATHDQSNREILQRVAAQWRRMAEEAAASEPTSRTTSEPTPKADLAPDT
jgi:hypothetical protein